ncbi:MAG: bifunctional nuclease family protein [Prevotella sp.]|nr:bifunctional nuclease family protein [Prevotella sp.]MBR7093669.1 bifunctional nuclease family protein [Prevotella sp.]
MSLMLLRFKGFSEIYGNDGLGLLVLTTEDETRQLSVVCDRWTLRQFTLRQRLGGKGEVLLPEVLWTAISRYTDLSFEIRITGLRDGEWVAYLYNMALQQALRLRASDAVLLSEIAGIPLYIDTALMLRQSVPYDGNAQQVAIPITLITSDMLKRALERAIEEENYEQASQLRDELKRREES